MSNQANNPVMTRASSAIPAARDSDWCSPSGRSATVLDHIYGRSVSTSLTLTSTLIVVGFGMRLLGLLFNGMHDLDQMLLEWGASVNTRGVGGAYQGIYGIFTYAIFGLAAKLAYYVPRFWWAPYKLIEMAFEFAVWQMLRRMVPPQYKLQVLVMYWANPWFALHGAWQGFWDSPHTLMAVFTVFMATRVRGWRASFLGGLALGVGAFLKPQGLIFFFVPTWVYAIARYVLLGDNFVVWFSCGGLFAALSATLLAVMTGGRAWDIPRSYINLQTIMPNLSNGAINIWQTVTFLIQSATGQSGPARTLVLTSSIKNTLHLLAMFVTMLMVIVVSLRVCLSQEVCGYGRVGATGVFETIRARWRGRSGQTRSTWRPSESQGLLLILALCGLFMPQFSTRMHINHAYAGLVLLIPFACMYRGLFYWWSSMIAIHFYGHLARYGFGRPEILPTPIGNHPDAQWLVARIGAEMLVNAKARLLFIQAAMNSSSSRVLSVNGLVSPDWAAAIIGAGQFVAVVAVLVYCMRRTNILVAVGRSATEPRMVQAP